MARFHKDKGNRGEREWRDFLRKHGFKAWRQRDGLIDVESNVAGVHWEVKRQENPKNFWKWIEQAVGDAEKLHQIPVVAFRRNFQPWYCIVPGDFMMELLQLRQSKLEEELTDSEA